MIRASGRRSDLWFPDSFLKLVHTDHHLCYGTGSIPRTGMSGSCDEDRT